MNLLSLLFFTEFQRVFENFIKDCVIAQKLQPCSVVRRVPILRLSLLDLGAFNDNQQLKLLKQLIFQRESLRSTANH